MNHGKFRHNCAFTLLAWCVLASLSWGQIIGGNVWGGGNVIAKAQPAGWWQAKANAYTDAAAQLVAVDAAWLETAATGGLAASGAFEIGCWVNLDSSGAQGIAGRWGGSSSLQQYLLYYSSAPKFLVRDTDNSTATVEATFGSLSVGTWYFIRAGRTAGGALFIQVNDGTVDTQAMPKDFRTSSQDFEVGRYAGGNYGDCRLDSLYVKSAVSTSAEATALYNAGAGVIFVDLSASEKANIEAWWDLHEASGSRADQTTNHDLALGAGAIVNGAGIARGVCVDTDGLSYWAARTGSATAAIETIAKRPEWSSAEPAAVFDGVDDCLDLSNLGEAGDWTVFVVIDPTAATGTDEILFGQSTLYLAHLTDTAGKVGLYNDGGWISVADATADLQVLTYALDSSAATSGKLYRNGTQIGSNFSYVQSALDVANLGANGSGDGSFYDGEIREWLVAPSVLSAAHRSAIETTLMNQHGIIP